VRQGRRCLTRNLAAEDVEGVREPERSQLLRGARELDYPVELYCALSGTSRQAQGYAADGRESEARAKTDSIGAEAEISPSEAKTLLRGGKTLAEPPGPKVSKGQAVPNGHSQTDVLSLVGAPNRLEERVQGVCDGPREEPDAAEAVQDLAEGMRIPAPCRELLSLPEGEAAWSSRSPRRAR
jgi:hypothetical protein